MSSIQFSTKQAVIIFKQAEKNGYEPAWGHINAILKKDDIYTNFHLNVELQYWGFELIGVKGCFSYDDIDTLNEMYNKWLDEYQEDDEISKFNKEGNILDMYEKYRF